MHPSAPPKGHPSARARARLFGPILAVLAWVAWPAAVAATTLTIDVTIDTRRYRDAAGEVVVDSTFLPGSFSFDWVLEPTSIRSRSSERGSFFRVDTDLFDSTQLGGRANLGTILTPYTADALAQDVLGVLGSDPRNKGDVYAIDTLNADAPPGDAFLSAYDRFVESLPREYFDGADPSRRDYIYTDFNYLFSLSGSQRDIHPDPSSLVPRDLDDVVDLVTAASLGGDLTVGLSGNARRVEYNYLPGEASPTTTYLVQEDVWYVGSASVRGFEPVPEPGAGLLVLSGLALLGAAERRRKG